MAWGHRKTDATLDGVREVDLVRVGVQEADVDDLGVEDVAYRVADHVVDALHVRLVGERGLHAVDDRDLGSRARSSR